MKHQLCQKLILNPGDKAWRSSSAAWTSGWCPSLPWVQVEKYLLVRKLKGKDLSRKDGLLVRSARESIANEVRRKYCQTDPTLCCVLNISMFCRHISHWRADFNQDVDLIWFRQFSLRRRPRWLQLSSRKSPTSPPTSTRWASLPLICHPRSCGKYMKHWTSMNERKARRIQNCVASNIFSIRVTAQLVWWRSLQRTTSWQPPSTSFSSQEWKSKWRTRCFGQRRLGQRCLCLIEFFSGGMFWGSCFNCSANKCGRRGYAVTCCHVHLHGSSLIGACIHFQYFRKPSKHNFKVTKLWTFYGGGGTPIWDCYRQRYARMNPTPLSGVFYLLKMMFWIQPIQRNG